MKSILIPLLFLTACTTQAKIPVVYTSDTHVEWKQEILDACKDESIVMTLFLFEAKGRVWTEQDVKDVEKFLMDSCVYNKNVTI